MSTAPLPSFILAGASYSGAEMLHKLLQANPALHFPPSAPMSFFYRSNLYARGIDHYRELFTGADSHRMAGDIGVQYFERSIVLNTEKKYSWNPQDDSAFRIKKHIPDAKIILCLRAPLIRASLQFQQAKSGKFEKVQTLSEALSEELNGIRKPETHPLCYLYRNLYATHISHWRKLFGQSNIFVITYESLMTSTQQTLNDAERFIGVRPHATDALTLARAKGEIGPAIAKLAEIMEAFPFLKNMSDIVLKKSVKSKPELPLSPLSDDISLRIENILAEDHVKLEALLGPLSNKI